MLEGQRRKGGVTGIDPHAFDSGEQQDWPDEVESKCGRDERRKRRARRRTLGAERHGKMTDEHRDPILSDSPSSATGCRVRLQPDQA